MAAPAHGAARGERPTPDAEIDFRLRGVDVRHPGTSTEVLRRVDLDIRHGEQVALVGASGAGKSTLLATLALARAPSAGTVEAFGSTPWSQSSAARHRLRRRLFLAPQAPPLPPRQRVVDAVLAGRLPHWTLWTAARSLVHPRDAAAAADALARFGLEDKLFDRVDRLSGGERQRVALARALVATVNAFLVDEPLSALDPTLAERTLGVLQDEAARRGATLVCSLHQVALARRRFPRLVGLRDGRVLFDRPSAAVDAALLGTLYGDGDRDPVRTDDFDALDASVSPIDARYGERAPGLADGSRL